MVIVIIFGNDDLELVISDSSNDEFMNVLKETLLNE